MPGKKIGYVVKIKGFLGWYDHASFKLKRRAKEYAEQKRRAGYKVKVVKQTAVYKVHLL